MNYKEYLKTSLDDKIQFLSFFGDMLEADEKKELESLKSKKKTLEREDKINDILDD